jgi:hypothetical protein
MKKIGTLQTLIMDAMDVNIIINAISLFTVIRHTLYVGIVQQVRGA